MAEFILLYDPPRGKSKTGSSVNIPIDYDRIFSQEGDVHCRDKSKGQNMILNVDQISSIVINPIVCEVTIWTPKLGFTYLFTTLEDRNKFFDNLTARLSLVTPAKGLKGFAA